MSIQHFATFWAHSQSQGSARLVGVALAQHANASTDLAWPSISTLMVETRLSERAVREGLAELLALGDFVEAGKVRSSRAFRLEVQCPAECDGTPAHARTEARDLAAARRASERDRKRAQRAARRSSDEDPAEVVEATLEELSRQDLPGQEDARSTGRRIVPAESAGMSRQILPGHEGSSLIRELSSRTTTTSEGAAASRSRGPVAAEAVAQGASAGGGDDLQLEALARAVRAALPPELRQAVNRRGMRAALQGPAGLGVTPEQAQEAVRARSWAGAGAGALICWLRDLEPPVAVTAPTRARSFCEAHSDVETTTRECGACKRERAARGQAYLNARRARRRGR